MYFRNYYGLEKDLEYRVIKFKIYFYGKDILFMCIVVILEEENILLLGLKVIGKNLFVDNLGEIFNRF